MKTTFKASMYAVAIQYKYELQEELFGSPVAKFSNQFPENYQNVA